MGKGNSCRSRRSGCARNSEGGRRGNVMRSGRSRGRISGSVANSTSIFVASFVPEFIGEFLS